jgi:translation elongation factor EF-G
LPLSSAYRPTLPTTKNLTLIICSDAFFSAFRTKLRHNCAAVQVPIGLEGELAGLVDLIDMKAYSFEGSSGEIIKERPIPADMQAACEEKRTELIEKLAEVDEEMAEKFLGEEKVDGRTLRVRESDADLLSERVE